MLYHVKVIIHRVFDLRKGLDKIFSVKRTQLTSNIHEDDFRQVGDGVAQHRERAQAVEILNAPKIAFRDVGFGIQSTSARNLIEYGFLEQDAEGISPRRFVQSCQQ